MVNLYIKNHDNLGRFYKMIKYLTTILIITNLIFSGTLTGTVSYSGKAPKAKTVKMDADPVCGKAHNDEVKSETFIVDENNNLKNVLVWIEDVKTDITGDKLDPAVIDQKGCIYIPHVIGIMKNQEVLIKNSDPAMHNVHSMPVANESFNFPMSKSTKVKSAVFKKSEEPFYIKCDVHPWMKSWVLVSDNPYFAVTDDNGNFTISDIPKGTYNVVFWQERLSNVDEKKYNKQNTTLSITITEDGVTEQNFIFDKPVKKAK